MKKYTAPGVFILIIILLLNASFRANSQGRPDVNPTLKVIPPSPTAASLGKHGDIPVSYYTGSTNASIPLYNIQTQNLSLNIELNYSSNGLKVAEDASWVGHGWSLLAGGVITRVVRGKDDLNGFFKEPAFPPNWSTDHSNQDWLDRLVRLSRIGRGYEDAEPDIFYFNFAENNGKFLIDKEANGNVANGGNVYSATGNKLKIQYLYNPDVSLYWLITDENGIKYYFNKTETTQDQGITIPEYNTSTSVLPVLNDQLLKEQVQSLTHFRSNAVTSWYLSKIESPSGESIDLEYEADPIHVSPVSYFEEQFVPDLTGGIHSNFHLSCQAHTSLHLKRISFKNGYVLFNNPVTVTASEIQRLDLALPAPNSNKPKKLKNIEIYNNAAKLIKKYVLGHGYFTTSGTVNADSRLRLESVTEFGGDGITAKPPYQLTYFDEDENFPAKDSKAVDWFGYYNGHEENVNVLPQMLSPSGNLYVGADRTSSDNISYYKKGVLKSITYPTGGRSEFDYELADYANNFQQGKSVAITKDASFQYVWSSSDDCRTSVDPNCIVPQISDPVVWSISVQEANLAQQANLVQEATISFYGTEEIGIGEGSISASYPNGSNCNDLIATCGFLNTMAYVTLEYWSNPNVDLTLPNPPSPTTRTNYSAWSTENCQCTTQHIPIPAGTYRLFIPSHIIDRSKSFYASLSYRRLIYPPSIAGIRVKSITNFDKAAHISKRSFRYTHDGTATGSSTGILLNVPVIKAHVPMQLFNALGGGEYGNPYTVSALMRTSSSSSPIDFSANGALIGHSKVTEIVGENEEGGRIEYIYKNYEDAPSEYAGIPGYSNSDNGQLINIIYKDKPGTIVKRIVNEYTNLSTYTIPALKVVSAIRNPDYWTAYAADNYFYTLPYINNSSWWELTTRTEITYANGRSYEVVSTYNYNNIMHKEVTSETISQSDGSTIVKKYKRMLDYTNTTSKPAFSKMNDQHIISPVIEQQTLLKKSNEVNYRLVSGTVTDYEVIAPNLVLPSITYQLNSVAQLTDLTETSISGTVLVKHPQYVGDTYFDQYDATTGNLLSYHRLTNPVNSYVWDYSNGTPIAEVINAAQSDLAYTSFEADGSGNWGIGSLLRHTAQKFTGVQSYDVSKGSISKSSLGNTKTYVLSFWARTGTVPTLSVGAPTAGQAKNGWTYYEKTFTSATGVTISGSGIIDELRLFPKGALMTTYTYDPLIGMTSSTDGNSVSTYYEYDLFGRLQTVKDDKGNIVKNTSYHYKQQ